MTLRWRRLNKLIADTFGYFWRPCTLCGQMYGGHEWKDIDGKVSYITIYKEVTPYGCWAEGVGICPECIRLGKGRGISD